MNTKALQTSLHYVFKDITLLECALTHRSVHKDINNERLEFLGDAVLSLVISTELYRRHPTMTEGALSRLRSTLVKGETIAALSAKLELGKYLSLGVGEKRSGGAHRESILAGVFESIIGAIFLDSDFEKIQSLILAWYAHLFEDIAAHAEIKDAKTTLQEYLQSKKMPLPQYSCTATGKSHQPRFEVKCTVKTLSHETRGVSTSRRKAEQIAAKAFLKWLQHE